MNGRKSRGDDDAGAGAVAADAGIRSRAPPDRSFGGAIPAGAGIRCRRGCNMLRFPVHATVGTKAP